MVIRRLLVAALILALGASASSARNARVLVIKSLGKFTNSGDEAKTSRARAMKWADFQSALWRLGTNYDVAEDCGVKTEWARMGVMPSGSSTTSYDGIIIYDFPGHSRAQCSSSFLDSLTLVRDSSGVGVAPRVPILFVFTNNLPNNGLQQMYDLATTNASFAACSAGVSGPNDISILDNPHVATWPGSSTQIVTGIYQPGQTERVLSSSYVGYAVLNATPPAGGVRPILATRGRPAINRNIIGKSVANADSMGVSANPDTVAIWQRMMTHVAGAKPLTFVYYMGGSDLQDSTSGGNDDMPCEGEAPILVAALAAFDSLVAGDVITKPLRFGLTIEGAMSRGGRRHPWALFGPDSSVAKASIDSLASCHIPAVVTINAVPDSMTAYASEFGWWSRWKEVRYTPLPRLGLDVPALGLGSGPLSDPFGRLRPRIFRGDDSGAGGDSSLYSGVSYYRNLLRLRGLNLSATAVVPNDDWSPLNSTRPDSAMLVYKSLGFSTIVVDAQKPRRFFPAANPVGWGADLFPQGDYGRLRLIGHTGYNLSGGALQWDVRSDSIPPYTSCFISSNCTPVSYEQQRWWAGNLWNNHLDYDYIPFDNTSSTEPCSSVGPDNLWCDVNRPMADKFFWFKRASVIRIGVNDLAGDPSGPPARWAWWALKSMDDSFRIINRIAGRDVVGWAYPEEISLR